MKKILIIGQALPAVKQTVPYDTTLLYDIFEWVGVSKEQAQDMFEFDAVVGEFTGFDKNGGHKKPTKAQAADYYSRVLVQKIDNHKKIILLGAVAFDYYFDILKTTKDIHYMIHPSRRNYAKIINNKDLITKDLKHFLEN